MTRTRHATTRVHRTLDSATAHRRQPRTITACLHSVSRTVSVVGRETERSRSVPPSARTAPARWPARPRTHKSDTDSRHRDTHGDSTQTYGTTNTQQPASSSSTPIVWPCHHSIVVLDCTLQWQCNRHSQFELSSVVAADAPGHKTFRLCNDNYPNSRRGSVCGAAAIKNERTKARSQQMRCPVQWHAGRLGPWGQARIPAAAWQVPAPTITSGATLPQRMPPPQCDRTSAGDATLT